MGGMYMDGMEYWSDEDWAGWQYHLMSSGNWDPNWGDWYGLMTDEDWAMWYMMQEQMAKEIQGGEDEFGFNPPGGWDDEGHALDDEGKIIPVDENGYPVEWESAVEKGWISFLKAGKKMARGVKRRRRK